MKKLVGFIFKTFYFVGAYFFQNSGELIFLVSMIHIPSMYIADVIDAQLDRLKTQLINLQ